MHAASAIELFLLFLFSFLDFFKLIVEEKFEVGNSRLRLSILVTAKNDRQLIYLFQC